MLIAGGAGFLLCCFLGFFASYYNNFYIPSRTSNAKKGESRRHVKTYFIFYCEDNKWSSTRSSSIILHPNHVFHDGVETNSSGIFPNHAYSIFMISCSSSKPYSIYQCYIQILSLNDYITKYYYATIGLRLGYWCCSDGFEQGNNFSFCDCNGFHVSRRFFCEGEH